MTSEPNEADMAPEPPIGVHVLSEFIYCRRAGLHVCEQDEEDRGREDPIMRLDYLSCYELRKIEEQIMAHLSAMWWMVYVLMACTVLAVLLVLFVHGAFLWVGLAALAIVGISLFREFKALYFLQRQREIAWCAPPREPDADSRDDEPVNWWSLKAAGFESMLCQETLCDPQLNVQGCPWRILRRGDLSIPAFVRKTSGRVRPQQRARITAYCHLIRVNEGAKSPYGIILDRGTFEGLAVKPTSADLQEVRNWLQRARRVIVESEQDDEQMPAEPTDTEICKRCPHGEPRRYQPGKTQTKRHGKPVPCRGRRIGDKGPVVHSRCGDRFGGWPPHEKNEQLNLR